MSRNTRRYIDKNNLGDPKVDDNDPNFTPTEAPCGSRAKVEVMAKRHALGLPLYHPGDSTEHISIDDKIKEMLEAFRNRLAQTNGSQKSTAPAPLSPSSLGELKLPQIPTQV
jgi:hypothetical protein